MLPTQPPSSGYANGTNGSSSDGFEQVPLNQSPHPAHYPSYSSQSTENLSNQFGNLNVNNANAPYQNVGTPQASQSFGQPGGSFSGGRAPSLPSFPAKPRAPLSLSKDNPISAALPPLLNGPRAPQFGGQAPPFHPSSSMPSFPSQAAPGAGPQRNSPGTPLSAPKFPQPPRFTNGPTQPQVSSLTSLPAPGSQQLRASYSTGNGFPQPAAAPQNQASYSQQQAPFSNGHPERPAAPSYPQTFGTPNQPQKPLVQFPGTYTPQDGGNAGPGYQQQNPDYAQLKYNQTNPPQAPAQFPQQGYGGAPDYPGQPGPRAAPPAPFMGSGSGMFPAPGQMPSSGVNGYGAQQMPNGAPYMGQSLDPAAVGMGDHAGAVPEGGRMVNLLHTRKILPPTGVELPSSPVLNQGDFRQVLNCSPDVFRCTLNKIPKSPGLLQKSRLPLGILIHPFKDLSTLQVLTCNTIVRCRACRSYINPFVTFINQQQWKCNLCERTNDLPQEFFHDPVTHTVGDPSRRPEVRTATIEYIAPQEYSLRPPQPAVYIYLLDISFNAIESRYLEIFCERLSTHLDRLPGDARTQIAIIAFDSALHFFQLESDWKMLTVADIEEVFLPTVDGILVRVHENMEQIKDLLSRLPGLFKTQRETHSCTGAAIQIAHKLASPTGGRVTVLQTCLPSVGPGALKSREDPNMRAAKEVKNLSPATDFYKTLALECSGSQVTVDLFLLAGQYADLASLGGIARYSAGSIHYYPSYNAVTNPAQVARFESEITRYLTRKIGFEAVMRVRCTNGMSMHSFHGNFFVRSTDLLSLPNINPDAGYAVQVKMDETMNHTNAVCFQAALLYTSSKGERRIRVHTLCCPLTESLPEVFAYADQEAIACMIGKIAAERSFSQPISEVRDGVVYACEDAFTAYTQIARPQAAQLIAPFSLRLLPLFSQALLKSIGLRIGVSTTLDLRTFFLLNMKSAPLFDEMISIYPRLYPVHDILLAQEFLSGDEGVPRLDQLHLSYENIERRGVYYLESALHTALYICKGVAPEFCRDVFDVNSYNEIPDRCVVFPDTNTETSRRLKAFVQNRYALRPLHPVMEVIKEDSKDRLIFLQYMHDDRLESTSSYYEYLTQMSQKIKSV